jgi:hypothetical protein
MTKKLTPAKWSAFGKYVQQADHHEIYKLCLAEARQTRKMFADDPAVLAQIEAIEAEIKQSYKDACAKEAAE